MDRGWQATGGRAALLNGYTPFRNRSKVDFWTDVRQSGPMQRAQWAIGVAIGLLLSLAVIWFGPKHMVVCVNTGWPNSMFGDQFGHTDGIDFTGCDVPTFGAWLAAVAVLLAPTLLIVAVRRSSRGESA